MMNTSQQVSPKGEPLFNLSPLGNFQAVLFFVIIGCLFIGAILASVVNDNTNTFQGFLRDVTDSQIDRIEVQRVDYQGNKLGPLITVVERNAITRFVSAVKDFQEYSPNHPMSENETDVNVWLTNGKSVEFVCYMLPGEKTSVFVGDVFLKPSAYSFGNGRVQFQGEEFYDWLISIGVDIHSIP